MGKVFKANRISLSSRYQSDKMKKAPISIVAGGAGKYAN
jgi:hypothetical protein